MELKFFFLVCAFEIGLIARVQGMDDELNQIIDQIIENSDFQEVIQNYTLSAETDSSNALPSGLNNSKIIYLTSESKPDVRYILANDSIDFIEHETVMPVNGTRKMFLRGAEQEENLLSDQNYLEVLTELPINRFSKEDADLKEVFDVQLITEGNTDKEVADYSRSGAIEILEYSDKKSNSYPLLPIKQTEDMYMLDSRDVVGEHPIGNNRNYNHRKVNNEHNYNIMTLGHKSYHKPQVPLDSSILEQIIPTYEYDLRSNAKTQNTGNILNYQAPPLEQTKSTFEYNMYSNADIQNLYDKIFMMDSLPLQNLEQDVFYQPSHNIFNVLNGPLLPQGVLNVDKRQRYSYPRPPYALQHWRRPCKRCIQITRNVLPVLHPFPNTQQLKMIKNLRDPSKSSVLPKLFKYRV